MKKCRCPWVGQGKPHYDRYHDREWGVPVKRDRKHFEMLILEGAQAGLSWETVLLKREGYRKAFHQFDPVKVSLMKDRELTALLENPEIIRNKLKVFSVRKNAQVFLDIRKECGTFNKYVWEFVGGEPIQNRWKSMSQVPAKTAESDALSKDLKRRGMSFVGSTIIYAYMQAAGLVNDHLLSCYRHAELE